MGRRVGGEQIRGRRGDGVGLSLGLRAHFGVDAGAQAERQWHPERDDREHEDVRQREQQTDTQAYRFVPSLVVSAPAKRKPTPRTVSM